MVRKTIGKLKEKMGRGIKEAFEKKLVVPVILLDWEGGPPFHMHDLGSDRTESFPNHSSELRGFVSFYYIPFFLPASACKMKTSAVLLIVGALFACQINAQIVQTPPIDSREAPLIIYSCARKPMMSACSPI